MDWNFQISSQLLLLLPLLLIHSSHSHLSCYTCSHKYRMEITTNFCVTHLTDDFIQRCSANQKYCEVATILTYGSVKSIRRGCATYCKPMCKYILFGIRKESCTKCCNTNLCNSEIASHAGNIVPTKLMSYLNNFIIVGTTNILSKVLSL